MYKGELRMKRFIFQFSAVVIVSLLLIQSPRVCGKQRTLAGDKESKSEKADTPKNTKTTPAPTKAPKNVKDKDKKEEPSTDTDTEAEANVNGDEDEDKKCSPQEESDFHKLIGDCFKFCKPDSGQMKCKPPTGKEKIFKCNCCCVS